MAKSKDEVVKEERGLYIFQSPLSDVMKLASVSQCGVLPNPNVNWDNRDDLRLTAELPKITTQGFEGICHLGVINVDRGISGDESLSLEDKLNSGLIFEHPGLNVERSIDVLGRTPNPREINTFTALEFIGHTSKGDQELNALLHNIIRVDATLQQKPKYRRLLWNCHDIAVFFAYLATPGQPRLDLIQRLYRQILLAKIQSQGMFSGALSVPGHLLSQLTASLEAAAHIPAAIVVPVIGAPLLTRRLYRELDSYLHVQNLAERSITGRMSYIHVLGQRFPALHDLTPPLEWEYHARSYDWLRDLRNKWWFAIIFPSLHWFNSSELH